MCMLDEIRAKREKIYATAGRHKAEKLWVFGSCARKEETPESDIDFLVKFAPKTTVFDFVRLQSSIANVLKRNVDIVDFDALSHERLFADEVRKDMVAV